MDRAALRQEGVRYLLEVVRQDSLLPSVQYAALCGWLGLTSSGPSVLKLHYLNGVEHLPPSLRTSLELDQQKVQQWAVGRLRRAVWEIQLALRREKTQARKMEGEREREQGAGDVTGYTVGSFSSSRFIIAAIAMLTGEHEAVDLSLLLNEGVVGLAQTALRLAASVYRDERPEDEDGSVVGAPGDTQQSQVSGPEALSRMKAGTRVVRGKDWKWGDQDGPGEGTVIRDPGGDGWVRIRWDNGAVNSYRMGENDRYDLTLAPSELQPNAKERETKDEPEDADISICLSKPLQAPDLPSRLLLDSVVCLLRSVVVGMSMHCHSLNSRHTRSVSSLLHHLLQSGAKTDDQIQSKVTSLQNDSWVTLGFLRGVASPPHSSAVFCTPQWIQLLLGLIENALPSVSRPKTISLPSRETGVH
ncbi:E3 ubiquitin-protein ligase HERC2 [Geodia barretti]|uniref:E3 ubiquitin-protein ligase HERC2 n=1 Tax=Geodia barretti TaxID=519541 RepID=A0AA35SBR3_GEOBA|nr:E3 ubiquitin-protein ligase HERC2 [Geodia barretti]